MTSNCEELTPGAPSVVVYEISGEPAIVINGVPTMDQSGHSHPNVVTVAKSERCPGFGEWMEGRVVKKVFGKSSYSGTVTGFDKETGWYRVIYEDGDFEDLEWHELEEIIVPLDITVPLKTLALKKLKMMHAHKAGAIIQLPSRIQLPPRRGRPPKVKCQKTDQ